MNPFRAGRTRYATLSALAVLTVMLGWGPAAMAASPTTKRSSFRVSSPAMADGGRLPVRFTCDGASANPSIRWTGAPKGTRSFAVVMHHVPGPGDVHWYWVVYGVSPRVDHLDEGSAAVGTLGTNSVNGRNEYAPPCSKGPGPKAYTLTVYALASTPTFGPGTTVDREALLAAVARTTLASASLTVTYERPGTAADSQAPRPPRRNGTAAPETTIPTA